MPPYYPQNVITPNLGLSLVGMDEVLADDMILIDNFAAGPFVSSVNINGTAFFSPNFNNTIPAAPPGDINVIWQFDVSGNISAYVPVSGIGSVTNFSAGNLSPLFTTSVANPASTPALSFSLTNAAQNSVFAGPTLGGPGAPSYRALVSADIPALAYVTSVAMTGDGTVFNASVTGSPITTSGTLAPTLHTQVAFTVLAGPNAAGPDAAPTFRTLVAADLPAGTGTVTSFSAGSLSPLFTTSVATATTTPALTFALSNAAGGTVFGNNTTGAAAPAYTIAPVLGIPGTSTGTIALASATANGKYTITAPANAATPTLTLPTTSNVLAGQFAGDNVLYSNTPVGATAAGTLALPTLSTQTANTVFAGPTAGGAAGPTFRALVAADIPAAANLPLWSNLQNAAADLTLANAGFKTTFNQTSAVAWLWANTTVATVATTNASPLLELAANYWATGAVTGVDLWTIGIAALTAGLNSPSTLTFTHTGSTGTAAVSVPMLLASNATTQITIGALPADPTHYSGLWFSQASPDSTNYALLVGTAASGDPNTTFFNAPATGTLKFRIGNADAFTVTSTTLTAAALNFSALSFTATKASSGRARIGAGDSSHTGFLQLVNPSGTDVGFIGFDTTPYTDLSITSRTTAINLQATVVRIGTAGGTTVDAGISRLGAASLAIGNGTAGNTTGNLSFNRVNLAGADYAGQATVTAGATTKAVTFAANYTGTAQPVIVLTPTSDPLALGVPVGYWVTYSGGAGAWTGFTVNIQTALAGDVTFNYIVIGKA